MSAPRPVMNLRPFFSLRLSLFVALTLGGTGAARAQFEVGGNTSARLFQTTTVTAVAVTHAGSGYTTAPTVAITGGGGTGALATATMVSGVVTGISVTNPGSGYTSRPTVTLSGGGGSGAAAVALSGTVPYSSTNPPTTPQFAADYSNSGGGSANRPSQLIASPPLPNPLYPTAGVMAMSRMTFGGTFAPGVPRYLLGDTIVPPNTEIDNVSVANALYWRSEPVRVGETFTPALTSTPLPLSLASVAVTLGGSGYTSAPTVVFSGGGGSGAAATATITQGVVTAVTLTSAGTGYTSLPGVSFSGGGGTGATAVAAGAPVAYYYSPHADRVFASQAGRVNVTWVTRTAIAIPGDATPRFRFRSEAFSVSSSTNKPARTIYWTERSFSGPAIAVPTGKIETVNPVYNLNFPAVVTEEYQPLGLPTSTGTASTSLPPELRTMWFQKQAGIGLLRAYNREGRILLEYLGALKTGSSSVYEFIGADIVDIVRTAPTVNTVVNLGEKITPRDANGSLLPIDNSSEYLPSPVLNTSLDGLIYYGTTTRPDGRQVYYAERENDNPDRVVFYWLEKTDAAIHFLPSPAQPNLGIYWPKVKNAYAQVWPSGLASYAHYTVPTAGSTAATGVQFAGGQLPQIVYQDDPAQAQTTIDTSSQRLQVTFSNDGLNRTLLKFANASDVWYVRLYTQADGSSGFAEGDGQPALTSAVQVGDRINAPAGYTLGGYIASGTGYLPSAYLNPFAVGAEAAEKGAIIPVNALPGANTLKVWWFKKIEPPSATFQPFYVPAKIGTYTVSYPSNPSTIVLASNAGSGDLAPAEIAGSLYIQNDRTLPGFNPNEEHALMIAGRAYALRDDLNVTTGGAGVYTSEPFVLVNYTSPVDARPAMRAFKVLRESAGALFDYPVTAGTILQAPMPLPLLPLPLDPTTKIARNLEVPGTPDSAAHAAAPSHYASFTFKDRQGYDWVYRGPHAGASPTLGMQFYYTMREGFFVPGVAVQPAVGTILPYLRPLVSGVPAGDSVAGTSLTIVYRPTWPANAPELRVAETLTLSKFGLPTVYSQTSANVLYQQSVAVTGPTKPSVILHDPIREKTFSLVASGGLTKLPASVLTTAYQGKTYFQGLPPSLQPRFFYDPLRGTKGALVLVGEFVDEIAGEDYLNLNVLSATDVEALKGLPAASDADLAAWKNAIDALATKVETFIPDPLKAGAYKSNGAPASVGALDLAIIADSDTAVAKYALTATGAASGWVTMLFANGQAFTPTGDPVAMQIFRVAPQLNTGELKVQLSSNPLDEKVSLRHSGDFAAKPEDYEFEWRYAPPEDGVAPKIYTYALTSRLANAWQLASSPAGVLPTTVEYAAGLTSTTFPRTVAVNAPGFTGGTTRPGLVARSLAGVDFSGGVPAQIIFSADVADRTGFVLYVNGVAALAFNAPAQFTNASSSSDLVSGGAGLSRQFEVNANFFQKSVNTVEVALYSTGDVGAMSGINFLLHASTETDQVVAGGSPWQTPNGTLLNQVVVGGSPSSPLGSPLLVMSDNYFTMRYRAKASSNNVAGTTWSRWMPAKLVEGWIKRVLAGINPFNQRVKDLYNNAVNTDVSLLTQAGSRWEGNVALSLASINDFGLIEIYETVLNRGKNISVDSGYDYGPANDALLLAAGYLNDLYTILGNEAYADAANPTISVDDSTTATGAATVTEINTSRFSFEGQVKSVLDEELALLRGRDDFLAPGVTVGPAYNRLYWNYTRGINSGEALYAVNYNIREKSGSPTANGNLDAADAQRMFPQSHGDAYGHYLTALKGYQNLLRNPSFTWTPRSEAVTVLGQAVQIDYFDERKFAAAAVNVARTAQQILALTDRQSYKDDSASGWSHLRDGKVNSATGTTRHWGMDEWTSRASQGSYYNWIVGNALLPDLDTNPSHTGVQVIDRTTVPEVKELTTLGAEIQTRIDNVNARLNPLGLSPGAIAFDISASELKGGKSHYEQIYDRSLRATLNAKGAFDQAARMTRLLRNQENQLSDRNDAIVDQEWAYVRQLIDVYGTPYPGEIGPGKTYAQGYTGPDLLEWFIMDRPTDVLDTTAPLTLSVKVPTGVATFTGLAVNDITHSYNTQLATRTITIQPNRFVQYADQWQNGASLGQRSVTGKLQQALLGVEQSALALRAANSALLNKYAIFERRRQLYEEMVRTHEDSLATQDSSLEEIKRLKLAATALRVIGELAAMGAENLKTTAINLSEFLPGVVGLANDATSGLRGTIKTTAGGWSVVLSIAAGSARASAGYIDIQAAEERRTMERTIVEYGFDYQQAQSAYEYEILLRELRDGFYEIAQLAGNVQSASEHLRNVMADGDRIQAERETFRQRAASVIQGYRTKDLTFRTFRNEALEQYRSLFDLAGRYSYLAAKSYDYETGLLGSTAGQAVISGIVASRSLGDLTGGVPQATVSTLGDSGLAGTMARMQADWLVAKPRLGINNPDTNGTLFSLRRELYRLLPGTAGDTAWQQTLEQHIMSNVMADADVAAACRNLRKADGSAVPGIVISFGTTIQQGLNFFGLPSAVGDHNFSPSNFATKIYSVGMVFDGYLGMDPFAIGTPNANGPNTTLPNGLNATPYAYLIPVGTDYMLAPPLGDTGAVRAFDVLDQALPLPFNLGATSFSSTQFYNANGTLSEAPWILRKHQAFRPVNDPTFFYSSVPAEFTSSRLVGRSVWNGQWKLVIPAYTLLNVEAEGLNRFVASVKDIQIFLRTYSHSGN